MRVTPNETNLLHFFFEISLGIMSSERNLSKFEGGQNTYLIFGMFKIFNFANFCR
jgi:hypothetical protein